MYSEYFPKENRSIQSDKVENKRHRGIIELHYHAESMSCVVGKQKMKLKARFAE